MMHVELQGLGAAAPCRGQSAFQIVSYATLQMELNKVLAMLGKPRIQTDGVIGSHTINAVNLVLGTHFADCAAIASQVTTLTTQVRVRSTAPAVGSGGPPIVQQDHGGAAPSSAPPTTTVAKRHISPYAVAAVGGSIALIGIAIWWSSRQVY